MLARANRIFGGEALRYTGVIRRYMSVSSRVIDIAAKDGELRVFVVSGEVSGDTIGARLMASLTKISPFPVKFSGVGGFWIWTFSSFWSALTLVSSSAKCALCLYLCHTICTLECFCYLFVRSMMSQKGLQSLFPMEDLAVMGIWELLPHLTKFRARLKETVKAALSFNPHVVVTVDSKGFSFRFLKELRASCRSQHLKIPIHFHYVAPSFWAWKGGEARLKGLSNFVDHIFCILPFEEEVCKLNGLVATFVGHPVLEHCMELNLGKNSIDWKIQTNSEDFRNKFDIPRGAPVVVVLPGSRLQEVTRMFPIFSKTMELLKGSFPDLRTVMLVASNQQVESYINRMLHRWPVPITLIPGNSADLKYDAFSVGTAALCTSGTVAVELQLAKLPCLVAYRAHILTEWLIRLKAKVKYISLPNILLDSPVIPEALFADCTSSNLASSLKELIRDDDLKEQQTRSAEKVMRLLLCPANSSAQNEWGRSRQPSMIAASALLYYQREQ